MIYLNDLYRLKCSLLQSGTLISTFDTTSGDDFEDYITFYSVDMEKLNEGKPCIMISHDGGWNREIQAMGDTAYITDSRLIIHFEQLVDSEQNKPDHEVITDFVYWVSNVMSDIEKIRDPFMILSHSPESIVTPSISPITQNLESVSFRISIYGR